MDLWELISELCRIVTEEQKCYLDIYLAPDSMHIQLVPMEDIEDD